MPGYPTSVSRRVASYSQSAAKRIAPTTRRVRPMRYSPPSTAARNFARSLPVTARGLGFVLPALNGFLIGMAIGNAIADELFPVLLSQMPAPGDPTPANYSIISSAVAPWTGVPNNSEGPPVGFADLGAHFGFWSILNASYPMYANPNSYGFYRQRFFFGNPTDDAWATDIYQRQYDLMGVAPVGQVAALRNLQHVIPEWAEAFPISAPGADIADNMRSSPYAQGYKIGAFSPEARGDKDLWSVRFDPLPSVQILPEEEVFDLFKWLEEHRGGRPPGPPPGSKKVPGPLWEFDPKTRELEGDGSRPPMFDPSHQDPWRKDHDPETMDFFPSSWEFNPFRPIPGWVFLLGQWYYFDGKSLWAHRYPFGIAPEVFYGAGQGAPSIGGRTVPGYAEAPNVRFDTAPAAGEAGGFSRTPYRNQSYKIPDSKIKTNMDPRWVATRLYNAWTELQDARDVFFKALPRKYRNAVWDARLQKWRPPTGAEKVNLITKHFAELNWSKVLVGLWEDQVEDFYYGQIGRFAGKAQQSVYKKFGMGDGPTYITRLTKLGVGRLPNFSLPQLGGLRGNATGAYLRGLK